MAKDGMIRDWLERHCVSSSPSSDSVTYHIYSPFLLYSRVNTAA